MIRGTVVELSQNGMCQSEVKVLFQIHEMHEISVNSISCFLFGLFSTLGLSGVFCSNEQDMLRYVAPSFGLIHIHTALFS